TRTSRPCSTPCCGCGWAPPTTSAWSVTPPRPSTPSPGPAPPICWTSHASSSAPAPSASSATTAPRRRSCGWPTPSWTRPAAVPDSRLTLVSQREQGPPPVVEAFPDDPAEAEGIAERIQALIEDGRPAADVAILFRTNGQSEAFE